MAINFPSSPSVNDTVTDSGKTWLWNGTYWKMVGSENRGISLEISDAAPSQPIEGDMWFESDTGRTFTYYDNAWVELGGGVIISSTLSDVDADTLVQVEEGVDDDNIRLTTAGTERVNVDASGDVTIYESLTVGGSASVSGSISGPTITLIESDISNLQSDVSTAESNISTAQSDITTLETDVTNINELQINNPLTSYTLVLSDAGKLVQPHSASANDLTIPPNSSVAFPVGTQILVVQVGAGQVTLVEGSGVLIESKDSNKKLSSQFSAVTLIQRATDVWLAIGDLSA